MLPVKVLYLKSQGCKAFWHLIKLTANDCLNYAVKFFAGANYVSHPLLYGFVVTFIREMSSFCFMAVYNNLFFFLSIRVLYSDTFW